MTEICASALARKRRKEILISHRSEDGSKANSPDETLPPKKRKVSEDGETNVLEAPALDVNTPSDAAKPLETVNPVTDAVAMLPHGRKKQVTTKKGKTQIQYDPGVPMSKEQLAAWRREARRVRNRESAAASRQKIRDRIEELEGEVDQWKLKFNEAMDMIRRLESQP
uniref:BZIP domain-containing protein n=1 Tax=Trieres chinensis TaxID=1514140 RepID=A0A7S1ZLV8_TRICV|mmetsp:Transcript_28529/g.58413  ORF Transcript_28529/g.58413 Transcript_28529/m.58413 type:complete len:168 (+) Transcript_28529:266-769(+)|eukprot:CAMPEP_0183303766 /NCGR_PEP_ID=MMETSP0160_2-20130417/9091_1 /TAXON_ID=2839 ORGANISM="Odontella Sinensis, Strain Grunow 1884" /NCGR_SAMPLE_ID=MMETSP0160_2 /ASSEMBLY_ACC=CAM_ASM_000250 /LENGTH=167 /DNA_ID=CAMNT_0025466723 /DNA_START=225 /DNA_END=728 /DNA_ORIENTATION=-